MFDIVSRWPGKSADNAGHEHPAACHMLEVAAVAERLILPFAIDPAARDALILLTALHDLGKINADFRSMLRGGASQGNSHWRLSELWLIRNDDLLAAQLGGTRFRRYPLYAATAGHHGRPSDWNPDMTRPDAAQAFRRAGPEAAADARAMIALFLALWPEASLDAVDAEQIRRWSWWLPGLVSAADWIGSNRDWFSSRQAPADLAAYLDSARIAAGRAIEAAGLAGVTVGTAPLFDFAPRPMQAACAGIDLPEGPMLAVIEDETGAGKTEAAMILAQRMMRAGKGRGLYVALPTMATSDAMFARAAGTVGRMFVSPPTLTLAHGRAALSQAFRDLVPGSDNAPEDVSCTPWLADGRRRALLADVGVGTIDQALLAALPTRFHTLRHFALSSKILIVDEVHELGEPYIDAVLARLLQLHRQAGGSAILITATLPLRQRERLMAIYGAAPASRAYPALSIAGGASHTDLPDATGPRGPVAVNRLASAGDAVALLAGAARAGAACVWVRNAVDDAIAAVQALRGAGVPADLLHARFALADRKRIEGAMLERFGKDGQGREGRVLVGTQVLESSLDLDFDVMVSDLAPMAALIQRAGRLWRHMDRRPAGGRPVPAPVLQVVAPDPQVAVDAHWLRRVLDRGAFVYPLPLQWRTADVLFGEGRIVAPSGLRGLIEAAHADTAVPEALQRAQAEVEGIDAARAAHAWQNVVDLSRDFRSASRGDDDARYPTRLGEPVQALALASWQGSGLVPWGGDWALAEVAARVSRLRGIALPDQAAPAIAAAKAGWPDWKRAAVTVCPVDDGGAICDGLAYDAELGLLFG